MCVCPSGRGDSGRGGACVCFGLAPKKEQGTKGAVRDRTLEGPQPQGHKGIQTRGHGKRIDSKRKKGAAVALDGTNTRLRQERKKESKQQRNERCVQWFSSFGILFFGVLGYEKKPTPFSYEHEEGKKRPLVAKASSRSRTF